MHAPARAQLEARQVVHTRALLLRAGPARDENGRVKPQAKDRSHLLMTVSEVASLLEVPARTVRHWSDIGYLPTRRTPGGQRRYSPDEVHTFATRRRGLAA